MRCAATQRMAMACGSHTATSVMRVCCSTVRRVLIASAVRHVWYHEEDDGGRQERRVPAARSHHAVSCRAVPTYPERPDGWC